MLLHSFNPPLLLKQHAKIGSIIHSAFQIFNKCVKVNSRSIKSLYVTPEENTTIYLSLQFKCNSFCE